MKCVESVFYQILINRSPNNKIIPMKGLRQEDPISPMLFLICMHGGPIIKIKKTRVWE